MADPRRLPDHLGDRPEGDALPVGKAAALQAAARALSPRRSARARGATCRRPRAQDGDEHSNARSVGALKRPLQCGELVLAADQWRVKPPRKPRGLRRDLDQAEGAHRLRLPLGVKAARPPPPSPRRARVGGSRSPSRISPGRAACSSRAATLTASPTTNDSPREGSPATTSPVLTPVRVASSVPQRCRSSRFNSARPAFMSAAARTALSASSSCSVGHAEDRHHCVADEFLDRAAVALDRRRIAA